MHETFPLYNTYYYYSKKEGNTTVNESKEWLQEELTKVEDWEKDQSDLWFWEKLGVCRLK